METDSFTPFDDQGSWTRALTAARVSGAILLLVAGAIFGMQWVSIAQYVEIFENMVSGGTAALPKLTVMVIEHRIELIGLGAFIALGSLAYVLAVGRDVARVIAISTTSVLLLLGAALLIHLSMSQPLQAIVTKFAG